MMEPAHASTRATGGKSAAQPSYDHPVNTKVLAQHSASTGTIEKGAGRVLARHFVLTGHGQPKAQPRKRDYGEQRSDEGPSSKQAMYAPAEDLDMIIQPHDETLNGFVVYQEFIDKMKAKRMQLLDEVLHLHPLNYVMRPSRYFRLLKMKPKLIQEYYADQWTDYDYLLECPDKFSVKLAASYINFLFKKYSDYYKAIAEKKKEFIWDLQAEVAAETVEAYFPAHILIKGPRGSGKNSFIRSWLLRRTGMDKHTLFVYPGTKNWLAAFEPELYRVIVIIDPESMNIHEYTWESILRCRHVSSLRGGSYRSMRITVPIILVSSSESRNMDVFTKNCFVCNVPASDSLFNPPFETSVVPVYLPSQEVKYIGSQNLASLYKRG